LLRIIPQKIGGWESGFALFALKVVYTLIVAGVVLAFLSFMYLMGIIPSLWW